MSDAFLLSKLNGGNPRNVSSRFMGRGITDDLRFGVASPLGDFPLPQVSRPPLGRLAESSTCFATAIARRTVSIPACTN